MPLPPGGDAKAAIEQVRAPTENPYETPVQYTYADAAKSLQDQLSQQASKRSKDIKDGISPNPNQNPIYVKYIENGKARILFSVQNQSGKELNPTQKDAIKYGTISRGYTRQTQVSEKASLLIKELGSSSSPSSPPSTRQVYSLPCTEGTDDLTMLNKFLNTPQ